MNDRDYQQDSDATLDVAKKALEALERQQSGDTDKPGRAALYKIFIGKDFEKYKNTYLSFYKKKKKIVLSFCFLPLLSPFVWFVYRKLYLYSALYGSITMFIVFGSIMLKIRGLWDILPLWFLLRFFFCGFGRFFVLLRFKGLYENFVNERIDAKKYFKDIGGVNIWGARLAAIIVIAILGVLSVPFVYLYFHFCTIPGVQCGISLKLSF